MTSAGRKGDAGTTLARTMLSFITARDHRLMRRIHRWPAPKWLRLWMICATRGGDGWIWYAMLAALALFGGEQRIRAIAAACVATGIGIAIFLLLKRITGRKRPCSIEPHCWSKLLPPDQFSFPSGHTITAFAMAASISSYYPALSVGLYFVAGSIAASRVLLGMHFLSDVAAGAAIGFWLGHYSSLLIY